MKLTNKNTNEKDLFLTKFKKKKFKLKCFGDKIIEVETNDKEILAYCKKLGLN